MAVTGPGSIVDIFVLLVFLIFSAAQPDKGVLPLAGGPHHPVPAPVPGLGEGGLHPSSAHLRHEAPVVLGAQGQGGPGRHLEVELAHELRVQGDLARHQGVRYREAATHQLLPLGLNGHLVLEPELLVKVLWNICTYRVWISICSWHLKRKNTYIRELKFAWLFLPYAAMRVFLTQQVLTGTK